MFLPKARGWQYEIKRLKKGGRGSRNSFDNGPIRGPIKERREEAKLLW